MPAVGPADAGGVGPDAGTLIRGSVPRLTTITGFGPPPIEELKPMLIGGGRPVELETLFAGDDGDEGDV
jgi:hypothetical protein